MSPLLHGKVSMNRLPLTCYDRQVIAKLNAAREGRYSTDL